MAGRIKVTIRDGRAGRDGGEAGVTADRRGAVLEVVERRTPVRMGDVLRLNDGTTVKVIHIYDEIQHRLSWEQVIHIGNVP